MRHTKSRVRKSSHERLLRAAHAEGVTPSEMTRRLLEGATIRVPEGMRVVNFLLDEATHQRFVLASERTGRSISALIRATLEHALGGKA